MDYAQLAIILTRINANHIVPNRASYRAGSLPGTIYVSPAPSGILLTDSTGFLSGSEAPLEGAARVTAVKRAIDERIVRSFMM